MLAHVVGRKRPGSMRGAREVEVDATPVVATTVAAAAAAGAGVPAAADAVVAAPAPPAPPAADPLAALKTAKAMLDAQLKN